MGRPAQAGVARSEQIKTRMSSGELFAARQSAAARGFGDLSAYVRHLLAQDRERIAKEKRS